MVYKKYNEASSIGIKKDNVANYKKTGKGVKTLFESIGRASKAMYEYDSLDKSWKQDLENYLEDNK